MGKFISLEERQLKINEVNKNIRLISQYREGKYTYCECECKVCGYTFTKTWNNLLKGIGCNKCSKKYKLTLEEAKQEFIKYGCIPLFDVYTNVNDRLDVALEGGYKSKISLASLRRGCKPVIFDTTNTYTLDNIKLWLSKNKQGYELLSTEYKKQRQKLKFKCSNGHIFSISLDDFIHGRDCFECSILNRSGENHHSWKGGITPINEYLRTHINKWKRDSLEYYGNKCVITGKKTNLVHHLTGFDYIVSKLFEETKLPIYEEISEYSEDELKLLADTCLDLHYQYGYGVPLTEEIHKKFHAIYGYGNNTKEQFEEFKQNYIDLTKSA